MLAAIASLAACGGGGGGDNSDPGTGGTSSGGTSSGGTSSGGASSGGTSSGGTSSGGTSSGGTSSGGTSSGGTTDPDSRAVGPGSGATQAVDLSTPEKAARVAFVALQSGNGGVDINDPDTGPDEEPDPEEEEKAEAKAAVLCNAGGTKDEPSTGQTRVFTYSNCKEQFENPEMLLLQDGVIRRDTVSTTATEVKTRVTYGSNGTSYLNEVMEPATERFRSLLIGTLDATDTFNSSGDQIGYGSQLRLSGAAINTSKSGKPRIDYRVGDDSTTYTSNIENLNQRVIKFVFAGPLAYSGACGAGSATVSTPTKIQYDTETSQYTGGQMMVQSTRGSATLTFNAEGTVSVSTAGGTQTYTIAQLASLCDAYN